MPWAETRSRSPAVLGAVTCPCALVVHGGIHGGTNREALVAMDSVRCHTNVDCELVIVVDERMHAMGWDSKPFACHAHV